MRNILLIVCLIITVFYASDWFWKSKEKTGEKVLVPVVKAPAPAALSDRKNSGLIRMYYDNGQLRAERYFQSGKLNGSYRMFHENGQLKLEGSYKDNKLNGVFKRYDQRGQLTAEELYEDNFLVRRQMKQP